MARIELTEDIILGHSRRQGTERSWVWGYINDLWQIVANTNQIDEIYRGWDELKVGLVEHAELKRRNHSLGEWFTQGPVKPLPIQLYFGTETYFTDSDDPLHRTDLLDEIPEGAFLCEPTGALNTYYMPSELRSILKLQDFLQSPETQLFASTPDLTIHFGTTSYVIDEQLGTITFEATVDYYDIMWATQYRPKSLAEMMSRYSDMLLYPNRRTGWFEDDTARDMMCIFKAFMLGPTYSRIEEVVTVINQLPYAPFDGTVIAMDGTNSVTISRPGSPDEVVVVPGISGRTFRHRVAGVWEDLEVGESVEAYQALTQTIEIESVITDPDLFIDVWPLSPYEARNTVLVRYNSLLGEEIPFPDETDEILRRMKCFGIRFLVVAMLDWSFEANCVGSTWGIVPGSLTCLCESSRGIEPGMLVPTMWTTYGEYPRILTGSGDSSYGSEMRVLDISTVDSTRGVEE